MDASSDQEHDQEDSNERQAHTDKSLLNEDNVEFVVEHVLRVGVDSTDAVLVFNLAVFLKVTNSLISHSVDFLDSDRLSVALKSEFSTKLSVNDQVALLDLALVGKEELVKAIVELTLWYSVGSPLRFVRCLEKTASALERPGVELVVPASERVLDEPLL